MNRRLAPIALAAFLASCGGGAGSATAPPTAHTGSSNVAVVMHFTVPPVPSTASLRLKRIFTVAQNTMGVQVLVYAHGDRTTVLAAATADISPASASCTPAGTGGGRNCSFPLSAPAGNDDFVITTYDALAVNGSFSGANQLGYGVTNLTITTGSAATVNATLAGVLKRIALSITPNTFHTIMPGTMTLGLYALDADSDVIVGSFIDANGNPLTVTVTPNSTLGGALSLAQTTFTSTPASGVHVTYAPSGFAPAAATVSFTASGTGLTSTSTSAAAIAPTFSAITDTNLASNNPYHGGMVFDASGGVYYSTPLNFGGISYYNGTGATITGNVAAGAAQPIKGGLAAAGTTTLYAVAGSVADTFSAPPLTLAPAPNASAAPLPNGSGMAYDATHGALWYTSGSTLTKFPVVTGAPQTFSLGVNTSAGVSVDGSGNVWIIDNVNNMLLEHNGSTNPSYPVAAGVVPFDVLANANGIFVTDIEAATPQILQINPANGTVLQQILIPSGVTPFYLLPDNVVPGVVWFDYLSAGKIGLGRMDTSVTPPTFAMVTDGSGPTGSCTVTTVPQGACPGAIGAAANGAVYMVFENTQTLVQVQR